MDGMVEPIELSGQTSCVETDTDCEVQYKSLRTSYGVPSAIGTDGPSSSGHESLCSPSSPGSDSAPSLGGTDSPKTVHNRTICEDQCQLLESDEEQSRCVNDISSSTTLFPSTARHTNHITTTKQPSNVIASSGNIAERVGNGGNSLADGGNADTDMECVWTVSREQYRYYLNQFLTLQPDVTGVVVGQTAKAFFDRSKLPVSVLSHIWNLSDVTKDGCLNLREFVVAMHLIVLRRNGIPIPDQLPLSLLRQSGNEDSRRSFNFCPNNSSEFTSPKSREWTKFLDSPQSGVVSPDSMLANFDFQTSSVQQNPRIAHPVAIRGTIEEHERLRGDEEEDEWDRGRTVSSGVPPEAFLSRHPPLTAFSRVMAVGKTHAHGATGADCISPPRTTTTVIAASTGPASLPNLPKTPQTRSGFPPRPPPRPTLSSVAPSASAAGGGVSGSGVLHRTESTPLDYPHQPPPLPPPRVSLSQSKEDVVDASTPSAATATDTQSSVIGGADFADFDRFTESRVVRQTSKHSQPSTASFDNTEAGSEPSSVGRKEETTSIAHLSRLSAKDLFDLRGQLSSDQLRQLVRIQRERNLALKHVTEELRRELSGFVQERTSLQVHLQQLSTEQRR